MAVRALLVANPAEVEAMFAVIRARQDLEAVPCTHGSHVLAALETKAPDVALIRLRLSDMDGLDVLQRVRAKSPDARVLLLLDETEIEDREGRDSAVASLAGEVGLKDEQALEVWTVKGRVAAATLDSSGTLAIVQEKR